jgi:SAM-dependent methyltransferase
MSSQYSLMGITEWLENPQARSDWGEYIASGVAKDIGSFHFCYVLHALNTSGLVDFLREKGRFSRNELPEKFDTHLVQHLMRYLLIRELLVEDEAGILSLTEYGFRCLTPTTLAQIGFYVEAYASVTSRISSLLTGEALYGRDVVRDGRSLGTHCATLFTIYHTEVILKIIREKGLRRILDLGCGGGAMLIDACKLLPDLVGYGLDISADSIAYAHELCAKAKLQERLSFEVGNAFDPSTWPAYKNLDAVVAVGALHEHFRDGEEAVIRILDIFADLIETGGADYIILGEPELYYDQHENDPDLYLIHIFTAQGFPRRKEKWVNLIAESRLCCERIYTRTGVGPRFCFYLLTVKK